MRSQHIACYLHYKDEFDSLPMLQAIWQAGKKCYLPVLTEQKSLRFVRYHSGDTLQANQFSILEPTDKTDEISCQDLDMVIMPLVAFDMHGHRLGAGGGYYDRTFASLDRNANKHPLLIGLAYTAQQADLLPADEWDIGLDGIVTEHEFIMFP